MTRRGIRRRHVRRRALSPRIVGLLLGITVLLICVVSCQFVVVDAPPVPADLSAVVEAEEVVYTYTSADNGADPLWCYGSVCIVDAGERVIASGLETVPDAVPPNNVRWTLYERADDGWDLRFVDEEHLTREPCPLGFSADGHLLVSTNPTVADAPGQWGRPAQPTLLTFDASALDAGCDASVPLWDSEPPFTEHSYRGMAVDGATGEALLMNINGHIAQHWAYLDAAGSWSASGRLQFPWDVERAQVLRLCYPTMALSGGAAIVLATSDVVEPVREWQVYKYQTTGNEWDYVFRRLYYAWSPDVSEQGFDRWIECANVEDTAGQVHNEDVWLAPDGSAHLLWIERSVDTRLRDEFFPDTRLRVSLEHAVVIDGDITSQNRLLSWEEGSSGVVALWARFHATPDGRLFVLYAGRQSEAGVGFAQPTENAILEILPDGGQSTSVTLDVVRPLTRFMVASARGGSAPSDTLHVLGSVGYEDVIRYLKIRLCDLDQTKG